MFYLKQVVSTVSPLLLTADEKILGSTRRISGISKQEGVEQGKSLRSSMALLALKLQREHSVLERAEAPDPLPADALLPCPPSFFTPLSGWLLEQCLSGRPLLFFRSVPHKLQRFFFNYLLFFVLEQSFFKLPLSVWSPF